MTTEREIFEWLCKKYVQRADNRQRSMGLQYTEAETHDLAREFAGWLHAGGWERRAAGKPMYVAQQNLLEPPHLTTYLPPESIRRHPCDQCGVAYDRIDSHCPACGCVNTGSPTYKR